MKKLVFFLAIGLSVSRFSAQQQPATPPAPRPAPPPTMDIAGSLKQQHQSIKRYLLGSADRMPEADFHFKPQGTIAEVRTFGQIIAHLANANYRLCARAKGEQPPAAGLDDRKETKAKAELVKALTDAITYCDSVYDAQTTASLNEMLKVAGPNNAQLERARGISLISNLAHNNEHYGNLVTYLRAKGLVPPSSDGN